VTYQEYCEYIEANYPRRHPHLYTLRPDIFCAPFREAVRTGTSAALRELCQEPHAGIYVFDMLTPEFCRELLEEVDQFEQWMAEEELPVVRPNTMNNYGAILDSFGFAPFLQELMTSYVRPFAALFYPDVGGDSLDEHHGFVVAYQMGKDTKLDFHVDASDVTLNVCLGQRFTGGELFFRGLRCGLCQQTEPLPGESFDIAHVTGQAILHRGNHRHGAHPITDGDRFNLILWCASSSFGQRQKREHNPEYCGWPDPPPEAPADAEVA
jgi:hypothetical protein